MEGTLGSYTLDRRVDVLKQHGTANRVVAALVFLFVLGVYWVTISPTTSFWDSGEFIAASYIMGLPHPPGTPLYVVVGRLFSLLPFQETALGVNLFSALSGALAILFLHLTVVRIVCRWRRPNESTGMRMAVAQLSGATASLFAAFSATYWTNAIEAEVYAPSAFLTSLTTWLMLKWADDPERPGSRNLLLVVSYILALGIGYHLGTYLVAPCFLLFILVIEPRALTLRFLGGFLALTLLGLSIHLYIPIRSALNPAIDENNPETWKNFLYYVSRKQYKPVSIFQRQAPWSFQFDHFWRYFSEQFPVALSLLGILGIIAQLKRSRPTFILIGSIFLVTGLGLIIYMNFTANEVRERDYFYALAFFTFATWIGIGLGLVMEELGQLMSGRRGWQRRMTVRASALLVFVAAIPLQENFHTHDRRGDYNAHDYGYNMLVGLEKDAIIFTNGDNDTFPLWFMQEVKHFRKDVRVVNLSLLNTDWYIWQLKNTEPRVPLSIPDEHLAELRPIRTREGRVFYVRDLAMIDIINTTAWSRPIYFAVTVPGLDELGVMDNLVLEGLVFKLVPEKTEEIDLEKTRENMWENYRYRGLLTPDGRRDMSVYRDPNTNSLVTNYAAAYIRLAMNYNRTGRFDEAVKNCERAGEIAPTYPPYLSLMGPFYAEAGDYLKAETFLKGLIEMEPYVAEYHLHLAYTYEMEGRIEDALAAYRRATELGPNLLEAYRRLAAQLLRLDRDAEAVEVLERWLTLHPDDKNVQQVVAQLRSDMGGAGDKVPSLADTLPRSTELEYQTVPGREQ